GAQSAFGSTIHITLYDMSDPVNPRYVGGYKPGDSLTNGASLGLGQTDTNGRFVHGNPVTGLLEPGVQVIAGIAGNGIERLPEGTVTLGIQATDQSGTSGNIALFEYTLDTTPPNAPTLLGLDPASDNLSPPGDGITNQTTGLTFQV